MLSKRQQFVKYIFLERISDLIVWQITTAEMESTVKKTIDQDIGLIFSRFQSRFCQR